MAVRAVRMTLPSPTVPRLRRRAGARATSRSWRQTVHGQPLVYLDNAATTQKPRAVLDAIAALLPRRVLRQRPPRRPHAVAARHRGATRRRARPCGASSNAAVRRRDRLRARHHRGDQPGGAELAGGATWARRRDPGHRARAPLEHRALAARCCEERGRAPAWWRRSTTAASWCSRSSSGCSPTRTRLVAVAHVSNAARHGQPGAPRSTALAHARGAAGAGRRRAGGAAPAGRRRRPWAATSTPSPATRSTARPASARSTAAASCSRRCRPGRAAAT